jgi:hypothetical protein
MRSLRKKYFGGAAPRRKPFRRSPGLYLEPLESREVPSGDTPFVLSVTPSFGTTVNLGPTPHPTLQVTFSEPMVNAQATNAANYALFDATGHKVSVDSVTADPSNTIFTLNYNSGQALTAGNYTLFVEGDKIADVDDGRLLAQPGRVVVANQGQDNLSVEGARGDGSLLQSGTIALPAGTVISAVTSGDLNNDGIPDLVVADRANNQVFVLTGNGSGGYNSPVAYSTIVAGKGRSPVSIAIGLLSSIGTGPDIVVASATDSVVTILANNGAGVFTGFSALGVGLNPTQVVLGNLTGSAKGNDIVVAHNGPTAADQGVTVLVASGTGTFTRGPEVAPGAKATAVVLGDFHDNTQTGTLDLAVADNSALGDVIVANGNGDGTFGTTTTYDVGINPVSLTVADVNRDGYLDIIAGSGPLSPGGSFKAPPDPVSVLVNAQGTGFDPFIRSSVRNDVGLKNIAALNLNRDPFPDLATTADTPSPAKENLFTLVGNGNGTYTLLSSQVAGTSSATSPDPSFVTVVSDPFIPVTTFTAVGNVVSVNLVRNGDFENTDLAGEAGNLAGWLTNNTNPGVTGSHGAWAVQTGTSSPLSLATVPAPPSGTFQAMLDEQDLVPIDPISGNFNDPASYQGTHVLYQDIFIPVTATSATLSLSLFYNSAAPFTDPTTNPSLNFLTTVPGTGLPLANQQIRIDIMNPDTGTPVDTSFLTTLPDAPGAPGVLRNLFQTDPSTPLETMSGGVPGSITLGGTPSFDLTLYHGRTIRIRIATVNNAAAAPPFGEDKLLVGVDNVQLQTTYTDTQAPIFVPDSSGKGPHLRNPGLNNDTTDPTIVGEVNDTTDPLGNNGSANNIAFIQINTNNPGLPASFKLVPGAGAIDALGNFSFSVPNLLPGVYNFTITVVDNAGNMSLPTSLPFTFQGPSSTVWQAQGPGPINVENTGVGYTTVSGRVTSTVVDPADPTGNTYFIGSANGGVWETTDGGNDWTPLMDFLVDQSGNRIPAPIGGLAEGFLNPDGTSAANVLYAATGVGDNQPDSRTGVGVLQSTNFGKTWTLIGNSNTVLFGAKISKVVVDRNDPNIAYVAVTSGGASGPGVYKTTDGGMHWANVLLPQNMFDDTGTALGSGAPVQSVTDMIIDPFNSNIITIGIGNIGQAGGDNNSEGVWQTATRGASWRQFGKHDDPALNTANNADLPTFKTATDQPIGRITLAQGSGSAAIDEAYIYVMIGTPPAASQGPGNYNQGTGLDDTGGWGNKNAVGARQISGLYRTKDAGRNWTKVMLRENFPDPANGQERFFDLNLLGKDASNAGALIVDPTNPNVVYVGGSEDYLNNAPAVKTPSGVNLPPAFSPEVGLIRVDTGNMRDTTFIDPGGLTNDGDDGTKAGVGHYVLPLNAYKSGAAYIGEGVYWYDLVAQNSAGNGFGAALPGAIHSFAIDAQGRLIIGSETGVWRGVTRGFGYDFTSGDGSFIPPGVLATKSTYPLFVNPPALALTNLNANLQDLDQTSVAIDPTHPGVYYSSSFGNGTSVSSGSLTWSNTGPDLVGPTVPVYGNRDIPSAVTVRVTAPSPSSPPGSPTNVYRNWEFIEFASATVERSADGGSSFIVPGSPGLSLNEPASFTPPLAVNPNKVFESGTFQDELLFGTNRVYLSRTSGNTWTDIVGHALNPGNANEVVSALAFAPDITAGLPGIYAGTDQGEVFVDLHSGADGFPLRSTGLPGAGHPINGFAVSPTNPMVAFAAVGGVGAGHLFETTDGGMTWINVSGSLPNVNADSVVIDPRTLPAFPTGRIFVGTDVGVYESLNGGVTWQRLGQGMPNAPVVDLQLNTNLNVLAAAVQGRGTFVISVDVFGPRVVSYTPTTPSAAGIASVTVTFNERINPATFTNSQVVFTGPNGRITPLSIVSTDTDPTSPTYNTTFRITFAPLTTDGAYSIVLGPNIRDVVGNAMDQNQNGTNGEPTDTFTIPLAVNTTDDGRLLTGMINDIFGHPASTSEFISLLSGIDAGRFAALAQVASSFVLSQPARAELVTELFASSATPLSSIGIGDLDGEVLTPAGVNFWVGRLNAGASVESIINNIVADPAYFLQTRAGHNINGNDSNWVTQLFLDLLGHNPGGGQLSGDVNQLAAAENAARRQLTDALVAGPGYLTQYITQGAGPFQGTLDYAQGFLGLLGRAPTPKELAGWISAFQHGATDQQFIAAQMGDPEFFSRAPSIVNFFNSSDPDGLPGGDPTRAFVKAVYYELFPNFTPSPSQVAFWVGKLAGGMTHSQVAAALLASDQYLFDPVNGVIAQYYTFYLGRVPSVGEVNAWRPFFANGLRVEGFLSALVSGGEYFRNQSPAGTPLPTADANWLKAVYDQLTGFDPSSGQKASGLGALGAAESAARLAIARGVTASVEYRQRVVNMVFGNLLGHAPSPAGLNYWSGILGLPSAGPGTLSRDEQLIAAQLGSPEYFSLQFDASGLHTNVAWVNSLYTSLQVPFDPAGASATVNRVLALYAGQRHAVANALLSSTEYRTTIVNQAYSYLGRAPTPAELSSGLRQLAAGVTDEQLTAGVFGTLEYFNHAPSVLGLVTPTLTTFVSAVFKQVLPFATFTSADISFWVNQIQRGLITRTGFALAILTGPTYRYNSTNGLVNRLYLHYLGRNATSTEINNAFRSFSQGVTDEGLIASLLTSSEYFLRFHPYP